MKKVSLISMMLFLGCLIIMAAPKVKQGNKKSGVNPDVIIGHTYTKYNAKISDPELAAAYDNGKFRLITDVSVHFLNSKEMELTLSVDIESDYYSQEELAQVLDAMRNQMETATLEEYYVKNGYIYINGQNEPVAVINSGGKSITFKTWYPFDGNTLKLEY